MNLSRDDGPAIQIDRVLGLIGEMRAAILQFGDLRLGIGRRSPVLVSDRLPFRWRSSRVRSSPVSVAMPLFLARRFNTSR